MGNQQMGWKRTIKKDWWNWWERKLTKEEIANWFQGNCCASCKRSRQDFEGKRLVLNIFPSINTPVCSASAQKFNELASAMDNTTVICISRDLAFNQKQFCLANDLSNVTFLSDMRNESFANDYGILHMNGKFQGLLARCVLIIDADGTVSYTQLVEQTGHEPDYDDVLNALT